MGDIAFCRVYWAYLRLKELGANLPNLSFTALVKVHTISTTLLILGELEVISA